MSGRRAALLAFAVFAGCSPARDVASPTRDAPSPHDTDEAHHTEPEQAIGLVGLPLLGCPPTPPRDPTLASVELTSWTVSKGHSTEVVRRILIRHADDVSACAKQLQGSLELVLSVDPTGTITKAQARASKPPLRPAAACLTQRLRGWRFTASESTSRATIHATFALLPPKPAPPPSCTPSLH